MRITHGMLADATLRNLNINEERLDRLQRQLTSGQRISAPSDDPIGAAASVEFRGALAELDQHIKNLESATSWLDATDSALGSLTAILHRVRELAVMGANDTYSPADRQSMANEVTNLINQAIGVGNSTYAGQYLFSGYRVSTLPFSLVAGSPDSITYNGDTGQMLRQIDSQDTVTVNVPGDAAAPGDASLRQIITTLIAVRDDLRTGTSLAVSARLSDMTVALDSLLAMRSEIGARVNRLISQKDRLESLRVNISELLSKTQDVDMTSAITEFATQQNVYQAALAAGAKAIQPSLLDYLR